MITKGSNQKLIKSPQQRGTLSTGNSRLEVHTSGGREALANPPAIEHHSYQIRSPELDVSPIGGGAGAAAGLGISALVHTVLHSLASASPCGAMPPAAPTTWDAPCVCGRHCFEGTLPAKLTVATDQKGRTAAGTFLHPMRSSANSWQQEREACRRAVNASSGVGQRRKRAGRPYSCGGARARPPVGGHARHALAPGALLAQWGALQDTICAHGQRARHGRCAQHLCAAAGA